MGFVTQHLGVQWIFWIFAIINFCQFLGYLFLGSETIFIRKDFSSDGLDVSPNKDLPSKILVPACAYAIVFCYANIALIVEMPIAFGEKFHFNPQEIGLQFIAIIIGAVLGEQVSGPMSDIFLTRFERWTGHVCPADRLWFSYVGYATVFAGLLTWGFRLESATSWNVTPCIRSAIASFGNKILTTTLISFAVDSHRERSRTFAGRRMDFPWLESYIRISVSRWVTNYIIVGLREPRNPKWTFLAFFFVFELGSLLRGVATSKMLIVGRAVAGIGSAGPMNGAMTIVSACIPLHKRPTYLGAFMGVLSLGLSLAVRSRRILLGDGASISTSPLVPSWPSYWSSSTSPTPSLSVLQTITTKLNLIGFILFAPAAIQFFLALDYGGNQYAWNSATVIGLFCGAGGTFIVFLVWEYFKGDEAMIPFSMVRIKAVWSACLVQLFFFGMLQLASYYLPIHFQAAKGATPMLSGVYLLPSIISMLLGAVGSGAAVGKPGYYLPWSLGSSILSAIGNGFLSTLSPSTTTGKWIGYQILLSVGRGIGMQTPLIAVQNSLPPTMVSISMSPAVVLADLWRRCVPDAGRYGLQQQSGHGHPH
ncbi:hypothetical protein VTN00DRAFT_720 [Thermoascus crustaceus]|uniref:uncharacterized protein n=1 Tax=Thermoascus crustaceus TaxID=5088 RepID=UPI00374211A4